MDKFELGKELRQKRTEQGKTQTACAVACGVCLEAYQKWERGLSFPRTDKHEKLSDCLGVNFDE